ncbi:MAG TPA: hypothetical protein VGF48_08995 [Thermoanaerobaculia bacterium]
MRSERRDRLQGVALTAGSLLLLGMLVSRYHERRPPFLQRPATIIDHVAPHEHELRHALLLLEKVRPHIPKEAHTTCFTPKNGKQWDDALTYLTAVGMLPEQVVLPPFTADDASPIPVEYVVAVREPFVHARYIQVAIFPEGALYRAPR